MVLMSDGSKGPSHTLTPSHTASLGVVLPVGRAFPDDRRWHCGGVTVDAMCWPLQPPGALALNAVRHVAALGRSLSRRMCTHADGLAPCGTMHFDAQAQGGRWGAQAHAVLTAGPWP